MVIRELRELLCNCHLASAVLLFTGDFSANLHARRIFLQDFTVESERNDDFAQPAFRRRSLRRDLFLSQVPPSTLALLASPIPLLVTTSCNHPETVSRPVLFELTSFPVMRENRYVYQPPIQLHTSGAYLDLYPLLFTPPRRYTGARFLR